MSGARYVRFYPSDWRSGCFGLTFEQEGLYVRICAFIFETRRRIPIDDAAAAKFMGAHTNAYRKVRDQLAALGKIQKHADGWTVRRAEQEAAAAAKASSVSHQGGTTGGHTHQDTGGVAREDTVRDTQAVTPQDTPRDTPIDTPPVFSENANKINGPFKEPELNRKKDPLPPARGPSVADALKAFEQWNATALRCGLPQAAKLTPDRQRKIIARLRDYGLDGWSQALANIERSSFLTGKNDRNWRADLGFLLQAASFSKVHDGGFGNGRHNSPTKPSVEIPFESERDRMARIAREMAIINGDAHA